MTDPRQYAIRAHGSQKYGNEPYVVHLDEVAEIVGSEPFASTVAYLHDVLEDTEVTRNELAEAFGRDVAEAVSYVTDPGGRNRKERKAELNRRLAALDPRELPARAALVVKAGDRLANVRRCAEGGDSKLRMYRREHEAFRAACHRPGLCEAIWTELDELLA